MAPTTPKLLIWSLILCLLLPGFWQTAAARQTQPGATQFPQQADIFKDAQPAPRASYQPKKNATPQLRTTALTCHNSTFQLRIPAAAGEQITLSKLQTFPDGTYIAVGTVIRTNGDKEGLLLTLTNAGNLVAQRSLRVNNKPVVIEDALVALSGDVYIAGLLADGSPTSFVGQLQQDLSVVWLKTANTNQPPIRTRLAITDEAKLAVAIQIPGSVLYKAFNLQGTLLWDRQVTPSSLQNIVGFSQFSWGKIGLVTNCVYNGINAVQVFEFEEINGNLVSTHIQGNGSEASFALAANAFNQRVNILGGIKNVGPGYDGFRNIVFGSGVTETTQRYTALPFTLDINGTAAMDNAGDALGYFLPATQQLVFIKHFLYSSMAYRPEFSRQYTLPGTAALAGITRSFDGGWLFGLNTTLQNQVVLLKTDSIGQLPGCNSQSLQVTNTEASMVANTPLTATATTHTTSESNATPASQPLLLTGSFDCQQYICPQEPLEDKCLSTYYKTYRTSHYAEVISSYHFLRGRKQFVATGTYDRVLNPSTQLTYGMRILDEKGNLLRSAKLFNSTTSQEFVTFLVDSSHVMVSINSSSNNIARRTLMLVNDDLQVEWTKTYEVVGASAGSTGVGEVHKDAAGNYFVVSASSGFSWQKPKVFVIKLDASGNQLWERSYEINDQVYTNTISATSTATSLVIVVEATKGVSLRLDKNTGQLLNTYTFAQNNDGGLYKRLLTYDAGRIFYAGGVNALLVATFDTLGRPTRILKSGDGGSIMRAGIVRDGYLYVSYFYYNTALGRYVEALVKFDSTLKVEFIKDYEQDRNRMSRGLGVDDAGYIYSGGSFYTGPYTNPFLIKYGQEGQVGICIGSDRPANLTEVPPNTTAVTCTPFTSAYQPATFQVDLLPDVGEDFRLGEIICHTLITCSFLDVTAPGPICQLNTDYAVPFAKDVNCTIKPLWSIDSAFGEVRSVGTSSVVVRFKKPGSVWLKGKLHTGCELFQDSIELNIQNQPALLALGKDTLLCPGDSMMLEAGPGFDSYTWQDGSATEDFKVKQGGKYYVEVSNSCGDKAADTVYVTSGVVPPLTLGKDTLACFKDTLVVTASTGFARYDWESDADLQENGPTIKTVALINTPLMVKGTTGDGCLARDTMQISLRYARPVSLGADTSFCSGDSVTRRAGSGYSRYRWSNGSTEENITVKMPGQYIVTAEDLTGCLARDTFAVLQTYTLPVVALGADQDLCQGTVKVLKAGNFATYQWQDGSTGASFTASAAGKYYVAVTDANQCKGTDTITVRQVNPLPTGFLAATDSLCKYSQLRLVPAKTYRYYNWSTGSSQSALSIDKPGQYILTVTDENGCTGKDTIRVVQKDCLYGVYIPDAFSPNGDHNNDVFRALVFGRSLRFSLQIFNRYGQQVFYTTDPDKGWDGTLGGKPCDNGIYVWQCSYHLEGSEPAYRKGHVVIVR